MKSGKYENSWLLFAATIFMGALLLFQIQPLIGRFILPWFGGGPAVWTVCMLFFQVVLFLGYVYAHLITRFVPMRPQVIVHVAFLVVALAQLPITPSNAWKPTGSADPTWSILLLLAFSIGMPYFVLSTTGPLLQAWFSRALPESSPYRLYALSNVGSLLALITYPFVVEPNFSTRMQSTIWSWLFVGYCVLCLICTTRMFRNRSVAATKAATKSNLVVGAPTWTVRCLWFALAMVPSVMLLATTNEVCTDSLVVPFLWVIPLALYLLSFILCFDNPRWSGRLFWSIAWILSLVFTVRAMLEGAFISETFSISMQAAVYFSGLFCCSMVCHGELVRLKPDVQYLTSFYLTLAAGGAAGGMFVALIAPIVFPVYVELPLAISGCCCLMLLIFYRDQSWILYRGRPRWAWAVLLIGLLVVNASLANSFVTSVAQFDMIDRNFYGVLKVSQVLVPNQGRYLHLTHGRIIHGLQFVDKEKQHLPTSYYGENTGLAVVLRNHRADAPKHVGVVGLGVGTVAAYGKTGDRYRFYEINPAIIDLANNVFVYLRNSSAAITIVPGDARISMEREPPQQFDVIILDAFSSDAIPVHLLTRQAFEIYLSHLRPDGILVVHISSGHFDLRPVVAAHADRFDLVSSYYTSHGIEAFATKNAAWILLSREPKSLPIDQFGRWNFDGPRIVWTDDRNSLFELLKVLFPR